MTTLMIGLVLLMFCLPVRADAIGYEWTKELVVIAGYKDHTGTAFGMTQDASHHIGMALFPTPLVALYLPGIDDVAH